MDPFVEQVEKTVRRRRMFTARDRVLVAVSGGADSVALLAALVALGARVTAAHVNHRLRGTGSDRDERFVRRLGARLGVEVLVLDGTIAAGPNLEERARDCRYDVLFAAARAARCRRVATGHTRDDQAETVLLRLLRGSGGAGLGAMEPVRGDGLVRPLLDSGRAEVTAYLTRTGLRFRYDRSNRDRRFTRNRVRRLLLPLLEREFNPAAREALARTAELLRDDEAELGRIARRAAARVRGAAGLDASALARLSPALGRRVVRRWIEERRGTLRAIDASHVEAVLGVARGESGAVSIPGGDVRRARGELRWRAAGAARPPLPYRYPLTPGSPLTLGEWRLVVRRGRSRGRPPSRWRALFDARALGSSRLEVRSVTQGARIRPLGLGGSRKLQDVFVDAKVPREERARWPVVMAGPSVIWVPGLVRSEWAPVSSDTREVVVLEARRTGKISDVAAKNPMCYGRTRRRLARRARPLRRRRTSRKEPI